MSPGVLESWTKDYGPGPEGDDAPCPLVVGRAAAGHWSGAYTSLLLTLNPRQDRSDAQHIAADIDWSGLCHHAAR